MISKNSLLLVHNNEEFFCSFLKEINWIINNKKSFRTKFDLGYDFLNDYVYFSFLIKLNHIKK